MKNILSILFVLVISISVNAQVLFLDAGHGGKDQGAVSVSGMTEAIINADFVKEFKIEAEAKGFKVYLASELGKYAPLKNIVNKVNAYKATIGESVQFISIHANFSENPNKSGKEIFVAGKNDCAAGSIEMANKVASSIDATVKEKGLTVLRGVNVPAILIEVGYLSNDNDFVNMTTPDTRSEMIRKILSAL